MKNIFAYGDKFDRVAALYVFCMDYHTGQWSRLYSLMCKLSKHLYLTDNAIRDIRESGDEWYDAHELYLDLIAKHVLPS